MVGLRDGRISALYGAPSGSGSAKVITHNSDLASACLFGKCNFGKDETPCKDDGNCGTAVYCDAGQGCKTMGVFACDDGNPCTNDRCAAGKCTYKPS